MSLRNNVLANYTAQGWRSLIQIVFIPLYISYLGIESYGLIGIFAVLQSWLALLDMGMRPALGREMARFTGGAHDAQSIWDLLRSIEIISIGIAASSALGVYLWAPWLATHWIHADTLQPAAVSHALEIMGVVTGLQFIESMYTSSMSGLQQQVLQNGLSTVVVTVRSVGAIGVLAWISPTLEAFFIWQGFISMLSMLAFGGVMYRVLPSPPSSPKFSIAALRGVWRYAAGIMGITFLILTLTQVDKILLSRLLPLAEFGNYALASVLAGGLYAMIAPTSAAFYPQFAEFSVRGSEHELSIRYHQGAQIVSVLAGAICVLVVLFADQLLVLWTGDLALTDHVAPILRVLIVATLLNGLAQMPYQLQTARGWTTLTIKIMTVAVIILIPTLLVVVPRYGAMGAAWAGVALNAGYVVCQAHFMHRKLLIHEKWTWLRNDILMPITGAVATGLVCRAVLPSTLNRPALLVQLVVCAAAIMLSSAVLAPHTRAILQRALASARSRLTKAKAKLTKI